MYKRKSAQKAVDETPQGRVHMAEQFLAEEHTERVMIANREDEGCAIKKKERNTRESIVFANKKVGRTPANWLMKHCKDSFSLIKSPASQCRNKGKRKRSRIAHLSTWEHTPYQGSHFGGGCYAHFVRINETKCAHFSMHSISAFFLPLQPCSAQNSLLFSSADKRSIYLQVCHQLVHAEGRNWPILNTHHTSAIFMG